MDTRNALQALRRRHPKPLALGAGPEVRNLESFTIALSNLMPPLTASCSTAELDEIENRCGPIDEAINRFASEGMTSSDCCDVLEVLLTAGDPESPPSRADISYWVHMRGVSVVERLLVPFFEQVGAPFMSHNLPIRTHNRVMS